MIRLWDAATFKLKRALPTQKSYIAQVTFSPDSKTLLSAGGDQTVRVWDVESGKLTRTLHHEDGVLAVAVSPDGVFFASGGWDKTVKLWEAKSGKLLRTWPFEGAEVRSIGFSPDSKRLAIAASRSRVTIYDTRTGAEMQALVGHKELIFATGFSTDGSMVASADWDGLLLLWDVKPLARSLDE